MWLKEMKYLVAYILPFLVLMGFWLLGYWTFLGLIFIFFLVPILELFFPGTTENHSKDEEKERRKQKIFDWLLYLNVPLQYTLLISFLWVISQHTLATYELVGCVLSMGLTCSALGINVAHELGHRSKKSERFLSKALLLTSLNLHFFIEHNRGHHRFVATDEDPASSKYGQNLYAYLMQSPIRQYFSAWDIENSTRKRRGLKVWSLKNEMIQFQLIQLAFLAIIGLIFGLKAVVCFFIAAMLGILLLDVVNYVEHYGLRRKEISPGRYETVGPHHSWNSNQALGRIILYDLTRHSDHHFKASRKYQVLRHLEEAPQLPTGYPGMVLLALIPPIWFKVMNPRVENWCRTYGYPIKTKKSTITSSMSPLSS